MGECRRIRSKSLLFSRRRRANPHSLQPQSMVGQSRSPQEISPLRELILDVSRSSISPEVSNRESQRCAFDFPYGEPLELRVFVDRSVVEVFANGCHYLAKRIYPARPDSLGVQLFARGGKATVRSLDVWQMGAIWPIE